MNYYMKNTRDLKAIALYSTPNQQLFSKYYISYISIFRSNLEENIMNTKNELFLMQNSAELYYFKQWKYFLITNPIPLQFFTVTYTDGISLWEYEKESEEYKSSQMIAFAESGKHRRGGMNEEGIYVVAGFFGKDVKIYDMKYYNYPDNKIKLLKYLSYSSTVHECFFKNPTSALCCEYNGNIWEYDLSNPQSIPTPTIFNKTTVLNYILSCKQTMNKKYIIAAGHWQSRFYILGAEDGTLKQTVYYTTNGGEHAMQIAEVRPNILITVDRETASLHDIRDIENVPTFSKLSDIGDYMSVIALESNPGDFAIGGRTSSTTNLGFVYIHHLEEDNRTITTLKYVDNIPGNNCEIQVIKELKRGTVIFGGTNCTEMCLWNYAAIPSQDPLCWDDQTSSIYDIVGVPY